MALLAVLGMHRSGTSLVAGMLHAVGWDVGSDEDLMPPKPDNPRGFVEHLPAVRVNDRVLYRLGGSWKEPPAMLPGWEHDEGLDDLRDEAARVAERLTARSERVLFKDPRLSLTLPLWQTVVDIPRAVLVVRPPRPVVRSLLRRNDGLDVEQAATLYVRYLLTALRVDTSFHVVAPHAVLDDTEHELPALSRALGHEPDAAGLDAARRHVESELWGRSSRQHDGDELAGPAIETAVRLHDLTMGEVGPAWRDALAQLTTVEELETAARQHHATQTGLRAEANELRQRLDDLRQTLEEVRGHRLRIRDERDRARELHDRILDQRKQDIGLIARLEQMLAVRSATNEDLTDGRPDGTER